MLTDYPTVLRMRRPLVVVQCRNVPGEWDGWNVYSGDRRIGCFTYKREALAYAARIAAARNGR